jgi:hypothetical protein
MVWSRGACFFGVRAITTASPNPFSIGKKRKEPLAITFFFVVVLFLHGPDVVRTGAKGSWCPVVGPFFSLLVVVA